MITILVGANEDTGLEAPLMDEEFVVRVMRLRQMYEWLVRSISEYL